MPLLSPGIGPRVWIGHAANVSSHYDTVDNLACVAVGTRRFTLFAPQLIDKLYVGPIDHTSMLLSMITIAERPAAERQAWQAFFDYYVFRSQGHPSAHLPAAQHGLLGSLKENYGKIRARVMHLLRGG